MKILQVHFRNLNSLAGSWFIDFTSPEITGGGIFAITGPTGAGKSTILDAICLALYGRTPRLEHVNKTTNEIMTRQTGECFSEIEFLTSRGRFRCHWSQHRARKAASGDLQPQKHEIVNCETDRVLESKIKLVRQKVVEVTGMDFNQFTRSILLAQGEFNTFLKADPDKRSPILEQITGTDIYSRISVKVHEINREKQESFKRLQAEIDGFLPLSEEQLAAINTTLQNLDSQTAELDSSIQKNLQVLDWHTGLDKLRTDLLHHEQKSVLLREQSLALEPERETRQRAEEAQKLEPLYLQLHELRKLQNEETGNLADVQGQLQKLCVDLEQLELQSSRSDRQLRELKEDREKKNHLFIDIRARDQEIEHLQARSLDVKNKLDQELVKITELQAKESAVLKEIATCTSEILTLEEYCRSNVSDRRLVDELSGIKEQFRMYGQLSETVAAAVAGERELQTKSDTLEKNVHQQTERLTTLREELLANSNRQALLKNEHRKLLGDQPPGNLYQKLLELQEKLHSAEKLTTYCQQLRQLEEKAELDRKKATELDRAIHESAVRQEAIRRELHLNTEAVERQQELVMLASRLKNYEKERALLAEDSPCPLCGSLVHPYIGGACPEAADEQSKLVHVQERLSTTRSRQSEILTELSGLKAEKALFETGIKEAAYNHLQLKKAIAEEAPLLHLDGADTLPEKVAALASELKRETKSLQERHAQAESIQNQIDELSSLGEALNTRIIREERDLHSQDVTLKSLREKLYETRQTGAKLSEQLDGSKGAISESVRDLTNLEVTAETLHDILSELERKRKLWLEKTTRQQTLTAALHEHTSRKEQNTVLLTALLQANSTEKDEFTGVNDQLARHRKKRQELFGDKNPDTEEQHLLNNIDSLEQQTLSLKRKLEAEQHRRTSLKERAEQLSTQTGRRGKKLRDLDKQFLSLLQETSIRDEEDFLQNRLAEESYSALCRKLDDMSRKISSHSAILDSLQQSIEKEKSKNISEDSREVTETAVSRLQTEREELQQKKGALNQQLEDNTRHMQRHAKRLEELHEHKKEADRWGRLHELIGSVDGKKFRNFAQGITFDIVLSHANRTLQKMSDRYILVREPSQPLELSIIDNYQAGEIRTIKNLSGGESFLVSMALALGLSSMASRNVQVDSLFLDEGFGTLDEETLQTALDILSGLHQEGKLIGVISHVTGLQERISAQIKVNRGVGGRSSLSGAGVNPA